MALSKDYPFNFEGLTRAKYMSLMFCEDRACKNVHIILFDEDNVPFCMFDANYEAIRHITDAHAMIIREKAEG